MIIRKSGFYDLSLIKDSKITVANGVVADVFDNGEIDKKIYLKEDSKLNFYGFFGNKINSVFEFIENGENSSLEIKVLLFVNNNQKIDSKIHSQVLNNNCKINVKILSLVGEKGKIFVDGVIRINEGLKGLDCHLFEENIFLGKLGQIEAKPKLKVKSNDVNASHSCKVERISKEKMFYLKSRGISENEVVKLLLEANIKSLFLGLSVANRDFYKEIIGNKSLSKIFSTFD